MTSPTTPPQPTPTPPAGRDERIQALFDLSKTIPVATKGESIIEKAVPAILELEQQRDAALEAKGKAEKELVGLCRGRIGAVEEMDALRTQLTQAQAENGVMRRALDNIYNHNEAARAAVIMHYGIHHSASANALLKEVEELRKATQWIPVSERLPEADRWVLVYNGKWLGVGRHRALEDDGYMQEDERWQSEAAEFIEHCGPKVTHWQPLPPAPNQQGDV